MNVVKLYIEQNTFKKNNSNNITGIIYFGINDYFFPEKGWYDFPIIVLNWWLEGLKEIKYNRTKRIELNFMDGPASIIVKSIDNSICSFECIWDNAVEFIAELDKEIIYNEVIRSARSIENICRSNTWNDDEVVKMRKLLY